MATFLAVTSPYMVRRDELFHLPPTFFLPPSESPVRTGLEGSLENPPEPVHGETLLCSGRPVGPSWFEGGEESAVARVDSMMINRADPTCYQSSLQWHNFKGLDRRKPLTIK